ncbi:glycoside hydrolase family 172 protein [Candidatus Hydrogenedentota bacterium]
MNMSKHLLVLLAVLCLGGCAHSRRPLSGSIFEDMMVVRDSSSARASSFDRTGGNRDRVMLDPGEERELASIKGAGCIRHIYFTLLRDKQHCMTDLVIRAYWDGQEAPSVEVPFGDLFGMRYERIRFFQSQMVTINPGTGGLFGSGGFNTYFPMPFADGARITLTNEGEIPVGPVYCHIDYEKLNQLDDDIGRFHAQWRRENLTEAADAHSNVNLDGKENYVILETEGKGNLAGYFLHVDNVAGGWYGEGDDMIFIDGEKWPPSFHGTGSEEIFGGGAGPSVEYTGPYTGFHFIANKNYAGKNSMYRFFVTDPIRFQKSIKVTIEHGRRRPSCSRVR